MGASSKDGPEFLYGPMSAILASWSGTSLPDPNLDAGPGGEYQGRMLLDPRYWFGKDQVQGYVGKVPGHYQMPQLRSVIQIPATNGAATIAALANVVSGTPMTLVSTNATGITCNIPYVPFSQAGVNQGAVATAPVTLDWGFAFGNVTSGSATITVANSADFTVGMPIVIAAVGNSGGTVPLLTNVATIASATTITVVNTPLASANPTPIGTGNIWGPSETWSTLANMTPTAASPWIGAGPALVLDPRQTLTRGISITGVSGGAGGNFTVKALDIYNVPLTITLTVGAGVNTVYSTKAVKSILSVTPAFTDAHNYSVGTSDLFGLNYRAGVWEDTEVCWAAAYMSATTGFTAGLALQSGPSTATSVDVRGTIQTSGIGPLGGGIGSTQSNGTVSSLAMTGNRLMIQQNLSAPAAVLANPSNFATLFGLAQF